MENPEDRFGMPEEAFRRAVESHGRNNPLIRLGMYVPSRQEVATMPIGSLAEILDYWMWESPTELIPSPTQIQEVRNVLEARPDAAEPETRALIAECEDYVHG